MILGIDASQANTRTRTGTEWYAFSLLSSWIKNNSFHNHTVYVYVRGPLLDDFPPLPNNWKVRILRWPPKIFWTQIRLSFEILLHRPDALFVPAHTIPFIHPKRTCTTIHDIGFEDNPKLYSTSSVVRIRSSFVQHVISIFIQIFSLGKYSGSELDYQRFSLRYALKHADTIFTVSQFTKNRLLRRFSVQQPIIVAPNAIDHDIFLFPYPENKINHVKEVYHLTNYILSIGRIEKKKRSLELVQGYYELSKKTANVPQLVFAGGDGYGADEVRTFVQENDLSEKVIFLGWTKTEDLAPLLAGAKLFCFLSAYEGFGVPIIQSIAVGTPVLASNLPVFHEIAGNDIAYCENDTPESIAEAIHKVISVVHSSSEKKRGTENVQKFNWNQTAQIIEKNILSTNLQ